MERLTWGAFGEDDPKQGNSQLLVVFCFFHFDVRADFASPNQPRFLVGYRSISHNSRVMFALRLRVHLRLMSASTSTLVGYEGVRGRRDFARHKRCTNTSTTWSAQAF